MQIHMYVCMYVCMYACTDGWMRACMDVCMYVCMYGWMDACMHVWMHACMYGWMDACMDVCMYVCMHVCLYVSMYVCMYVCVCVCIPSHPSCWSICRSLQLQLVPPLALGSDVLGRMVCRHRQPGTPPGRFMLKCLRLYMRNHHWYLSVLHGKYTYQHIISFNIKYLYMLHLYACLFACNCEYLLYTRICVHVHHWSIPNSSRINSD